MFKFDKLKIRGKKENRTIRDIEEDLMRNDKHNGKPTECNISNDEFIITINIDGQRFEMTYGQAAIIFLSLSGMYGPMKQK